tara:strand:+ start:288 stop:419 length:132 start_codon:yes stop_codon:yes gene_type:complete
MFRDRPPLGAHSHPPPKYMGLEAEDVVVWFFFNGYLPIFTAYR